MSFYYPVNHRIITGLLKKIAVPVLNPMLYTHKKFELFVKEKSHNAAVKAKEKTLRISMRLVTYESFKPQSICSQAEHIKKKFPEG